MPTPARPVHSRSSCREIADASVASVRADRYEPLLVALASKANEALLEIEVVDVHADSLRDPCPGSIQELEQGLSPDLVQELHRLSLPFGDEATPTDAELRIAQAQLVGWLEGLFHGIQTMLSLQQMAARQQLEQMRRALPPGTSAPTTEDPREGRSGGMYL